MRLKKHFSICIGMLIMLSFSSGIRTGAQGGIQPVTIQLEKPDFKKGIPLFRALKERKTNRNIADTPLTFIQLSELLWAANGQNRDDGKRTAPSTRNRQMVDIYVVLKDAVYLYQPAAHLLVRIAEGDFRKTAGVQPFVETAPVNLIFVADFRKWGTDPGQTDREDLSVFAGIEVGAMAQNVYLYGASEGLAVVIRGSLNKEEVTKLLGLTSGQYIVAAQTIGYPK